MQAKGQGKPYIRLKMLLILKYVALRQHVYDL